MATGVSLVGFHPPELGLYQLHAGGRRLTAVAEHTKSRGRVGVAGEGGGCSCAARGVVSPIRGLKMFSELSLQRTPPT